MELIVRTSLKGNYYENNSYEGAVHFGDEVHVDWVVIKDNIRLITTEKEHEMSRDGMGNIWIGEVGKPISTVNMSSVFGAF